MPRIAIVVLAILLLHSCSLRPGSLRKIHRSGVETVSNDVTISLDGNGAKKADLIYLGTGGVLVAKDKEAILIDPFFSHQSAAKIGRSVFLGKKGKANFQTDRKRVAHVMDSLKEKYQILAVLNAHSHYDHLMDVPAVFHHLDKKPLLLLSKTAYNITNQTIDTSRAVILENYMSTDSKLTGPIVIPRAKGSIHVYPILSQHNPHFRNIKFFSGEQPQPVPDLVSPFGRTRANLWLEGTTFSFVIDFVGEKGDISLRMFLQSSSCNPPWGIPPPELLTRRIDVAFVGVVSYSFSPDYPCTLLSAISPGQVVWVHWEDFFRKYGRRPKTVRGTDVAGFFNIPCVLPYKKSGKMLWPGVRMELVY